MAKRRGRSVPPPASPAASGGTGRTSTPRTCAICGQSERLPHRQLVFEGWVLWPDGITLCPCCRDPGNALAAALTRARDLRRTAARQRQLASPMRAKNAVTPIARGGYDAQSAGEIVPGARRKRRRA